jgi:putative endonuclease
VLFREAGLLDKGKPMDGPFYYVYMLQSLSNPARFYVGMTQDLRERLKAHNAGKVPHTSKFLPWRIETAAAFRDKAKGVAFERYLKSQSGRAFAKKHF